MPFPLGSDSGDLARRALRDVVLFHLNSASVKARLPRVHKHILLPGEREHAGVIIRILSEPDTASAWEYRSENKRVLEEHHRFALVIKADQKSGDAKNVSAFVGALKPLFASRGETPERASIEAAGLHDLMESTEGLENVGALDDIEGIEAAQIINLRGNTDLWLE